MPEKDERIKILHTHPKSNMCFNTLPLFKQSTEQLCRKRQKLINYLTLPRNHTTRITSIGNNKLVISNNCNTSGAPRSWTTEIRVRPLKNTTEFILWNALTPTYETYRYEGLKIAAQVKDWGPRRKIKEIERSTHFSLVW